VHGWSWCDIAFEQMNLPGLLNGAFIVSKSLISGGVVPGFEVDDLIFWRIFSSNEISRLLHEGGIRK